MVCDKESGFVENSMAGLVEVYACQLQNDKFDLKVPEELMKASRVSQSGLESPRLKQSLDS